MIRNLLLSLLSLSAFISTSCVDVEGEEEIWIKADASGRLISHYEIPKIALSQIGNPDDMIRSLHMIDKKEDGIKIKDLSFHIEGQKAIFHLDATFKDARKLTEISNRNQELFTKEVGTDPKKIDSIAGEINFGIKRLTPTFSRSVSIEGLLPNFMKNSLGASNFKYTIHLPTEAKETNAHFLSEDKRTVSWTFLLKEHFNEPMEMSFTTSLPIPWWAWLTLAILVSALAWLTWQKLLRP